MKTRPDLAPPSALEAHRILSKDSDVLVAWKPPHMLVHRSDWAAHDPVNLRDVLRVALKDEHGDDPGGTDYFQPVNRIDRATSGIVLFARNAEAHRMLQSQFAAHEVEKRYLAVVRGWMPDECVANKPLPTAHNSTPKEAETVFKTVQQVELPIAITRYETSRFSLVECVPKTGRHHQIRLHLKHLRHPVVGDTAHGDRAHNRYFSEHFQPRAMYLHSASLGFLHPDGKPRFFEAGLPACWSPILRMMGWDDR